jgi:cation transport protein ChaC
MTLSRRHLEQGLMRELYVATIGAAHALDDEALSRSLTATLAAKPKGAGWWVFGYGSLLWNPLFPIAEGAPHVHGLHRRFCLRSLASRDASARPRAGARAGVPGAFRLPSALALDELHLLWRREMVVGSYRPVWVRVRAGERVLTALAFAVRRDHPQYAALSMDEQANTIAHACGAFGSSCEYLMRTRAALAEHGSSTPTSGAVGGGVTGRQR